LNAVEILTGTKQFVAFGGKKRNCTSSSIFQSNSEMRGKPFQKGKSGKTLGAPSNAWLQNAFGRLRSAVHR
jgi:hypothetical protein